MANKLSIKQKLGAYFIPRLPVSKETFDNYRYQLNALVINVNTRINPFTIARINRYRNQTGLSVNVGAGPFGQEGWTNIDMGMYKNISFQYDCRKKLPFRDGTVDRIRCEHVFEHLHKREEAPAFLGECLRCLRPGGVLRVIVPDLQLFIEAYQADTPEAWKQLGYDLDQLPGGLRTPMDILNYTFRQNGEHKYAYDFLTLKLGLENAGFTRITKMSWGRSLDPLLQADQENHKRYSLYVDCVK
jgi:predicted SAM-dependent methyltransferase